MKRLTNRVVYSVNLTSTADMVHYDLSSEDSSVGISTDYGLDGRGSILSMSKDCSLFHSVQSCSGAHPASYPMGTEGSFPRVKRKVREAEHSPPSSAEFKNDDLYLHFPLCRHGIVVN
jgi:hypothetical protein